MSVSYFLVCMECEKAFHLSSAIHVHYQDWPHQMYGFQGLGGGLGEKDGNWKPWREGCENLQQFLMLHRLHELRVLPETVAIYGALPPFPAPVFGEGGSYEFQREPFFETPMPKPDPELEAKELSQDLRDRIRKFKFE